MKFKSDLSRENGQFATASRDPEASRDPSLETVTILRVVRTCWYDFERRDVGGRKTHHTHRARGEARSAAAKTGRLLYVQDVRDVQICVVRISVVR